MLVLVVIWVILIGPLWTELLRWSHCYLRYFPPCHVQVYRWWSFLVFNHDGRITTTLHDAIGQIVEVLRVLAWGWHGLVLQHVWLGEMLVLGYQSSLNKLVVSALIAIICYDATLRCDPNVTIVSCLTTGVCRCFETVLLVDHKSGLVLSHLLWYLGDRGQSGLPLLIGWGID